MESESFVCIYEFKPNEFLKIRNWNGFITPEGNFIKVSKKNSLVSAHDNVAYTYALIKLNKDVYAEYKKFQESKPNKTERLNAKDIIVNLFGFVNYEFYGNRIMLSFPDPSYKGLRVTNEQIKSITELFKVNNLSITDSDVIEKNEFSSTYYDSYPELRKK